MPSNKNISGIIVFDHMQDVFVLFTGQLVSLTRIALAENLFQHNHDMFLKMIVSYIYFEVGRILLNIVHIIY